MPARILLVDDEEVTLMAYSRYLAKVGYTVDIAATLGDAREVFGRHAFDILLLDLNLPDGNGLDWIAEVREKNPDMAVVVITGGGDVTSAVEAMRLGADNFLEKPVNLGNLDVFLRKSLELESLRKSRTTSRRLRKKQQPFFYNGAGVGAGAPAGRCGCHQRCGGADYRRDRYGQGDYGTLDP